jgi:hypothetical protein
LRDRFQGKTVMFAERVTSAYAGGSDRHSTSMRPPSMRVPQPRARDAAALEMLGMFERAHDAFQKHAGGRASAQVEALVERLDAAYPDEWLLRYELLAGLVHASGASDPHSAALQTKLISDLEALEIRYAHREPIATGLAYLRSRLGPEKA